MPFFANEYIRHQMKKSYLGVQIPRLTDGDPPFVITAKSREMVAEMCAFMIEDTKVAQLLDINVRFLRQFFRKEIENARTNIQYAITKNIYSQALKDSSAAAKLGLELLNKIIPDWSETVKNEAPVIDGPVTITWAPRPALEASNGDQVRTGETQQ